MSGYNEQHATTMLNALQGTETLERFKQEIKAEVIEEYKDKLCSKLEEYQTGFNMVSMANVWHFSDEIAEQLKENK